MAATACLFNLSKAELGTKIHPKILKEIVKSKSLFCPVVCVSNDGLILS